MKKKKTDIINLLEKYNYRQYSALTDFEKDEVNNLITGINEYEILRKTTVQSKELLSSEEFGFPKDILAEIHRSIKPKNSLSFIYEIFNYKMPAYAAAAVLLLAVSTAYFLLPRKIVEKTLIKENPVLIEKIVYRDKPFYDSSSELSKNGKKIVKIRRSNIVSRNENIALKFNEAGSSMNKFVGIENLKLLSLQKKGKNLTEDSIVKNFMFSLN